jgi:aarF domain-containing kinase
MHEFACPRRPSAKVLSALGIVAAAAAKTTLSPPVRRAAHFWKEAFPIVAHYRFAQWWLDRVASADTDKGRRDQAYGKLHRKYCHPTYRLMLDLRGLFVKVGQVLSSRPDFVPAEYVRLFSTLQDSMPQWPVEQVRDIVEQSLRDEHGLKLEQVFESIDPVALGSASIGQVHRAVLVDGASTQHPTCKEVAVKVMHPGAKESFRHDFQIFRWLCRLALPTWMSLLDELERRLMTEFDYHNEAASLQLVRTNLAQSPYRRRVYVPQPIQDLCCKHVLVMELLKGQKLVDSVKGRFDSVLGSEGAAEALIHQRQLQLLSGVASSDHEGGDRRHGIMNETSTRAKLRLLALQRRCQKYVDLLIDVHGYQIFVNGAFNGDPHPGNVLVLEDGRLGLIDYGQTRRLTHEERLGFARVVLALGNGSSDEAVAKVLRDAGFCLKDDADTDTLARYATLFFDSDHESRDLGFATPQLYYASLMRSNPLTVIPDAASEYTLVQSVWLTAITCPLTFSCWFLCSVFIARTSFLFRGMGTVIGSNAVRTAHRWSKHAHEALEAK